MSDEKRTPEEILDVNRRWLPPEPHLGKVIEAVQKDSAHIEKRGHQGPRVRPGHQVGACALAE